MTENFYFDIDIIKTLAHKKEQPGFYFSQPKREWDGFILITAGEAEFEKYKNKSITLYKGDIVFLHKKDKYTIQSKKGCSYFTTAFNLVENQELIELLPTKGTCNDILIEKVKHITEHWQMQLRESYMQCKVELLKLYLNFIKPSIFTFTEFENPTVNKAIKYIHENFKKPFKTEDIAEYCMLSASHLRAKFLKSTGKTITQYRDELRIKAAKELLSSGFYTVKETAYELGYCDLYYFTKFFTKNTGISPARYIKKNFSKNN